MNFISHDLREIVLRKEFVSIWQIQPEQDGSSFSLVPYENEIRECLRCCGVAPCPLNRSNIDVTTSISCTTCTSSRKHKMIKDHDIPEIDTTSGTVSNFRHS